MSFVKGPPHFAPLDWSKPITKYRRKLPHWVQDGATYFITFRLADSLPREKLDELERLREQWERAHPEPRSEEDWQRFHRETMQRVDDWLDAGAGGCWLRDESCAAIVTRAMHHFDNERYVLSSYCVMPNHAHVTLQPLDGHEPSEILKSWKGFTAREMNKRLARTGSVWEPESYDTIVRDVEHLWKVLRYIGNNPRKAGIAQEKWVRWVSPLWEQAGFGFGGGSAGG
jgi:putative transposase